MNACVFYSWQSDRPSTTNRRFIERAICTVLPSIAHHPPLEFDEAARGIPGTADIPANIFRKIEESVVAVFDVTPIYRKGHGKGVLNPNVAIELGYAAHCLGWNRIVCVFNRNFGEPQDLPFDLRHRRFPLDYKCSENDVTKGGESFDRKKRRLEEGLTTAIASIVEDDHAAVLRAKDRLSAGCIQFVFRFGTQPNFHPDQGDAHHEIDRLLDLRLISFDVDPKDDGYLFSYHWTWLGRRVCAWLHARRAANAGQTVAELLREKV